MSCDTIMLVGSPTLPIVSGTLALYYPVCQLNYKIMSSDNWILFINIDL